MKIGNWEIDRNYLDYIGAPYSQTFPYSIRIEELTAQPGFWMSHMQRKTWWSDAIESDFCRAYGVIDTRRPGV